MNTISILRGMLLWALLAISSCLAVAADTSSSSQPRGDRAIPASVLADVPDADLAIYYFDHVTHIESYQGVHEAFFPLVLVPSDGKEFTPFHNEEGELYRAVFQFRCDFTAKDQARVRDTFWVTFPSVPGRGRTIADMDKGETRSFRITIRLEKVDGRWEYSNIRAVLLKPKP